MKKNNNFWFIMIIIILMFLGICVLALLTHNWSYTIRFEMDNNTLEAIKSLNWTAIQNISK